MPERKVTLKFDLQVEVEQREGYFAARTKPFALTTYGNSEHEAEERAVDAVRLLLDARSKTAEDLSAFLTVRRVKHVTEASGVHVTRPTSVVRTCRREIGVPVLV